MRIITLKDFFDGKFTGGDLEHLTLQTTWPQYALLLNREGKKLNYNHVASSCKLNGDSIFHKDSPTWKYYSDWRVVVLEFGGPTYRVLMWQ